MQRSEGHHFCFLTFLFRNILHISEESYRQNELYISEYCNFFLISHMIV